MSHRDAHYNFKARHMIATELVACLYGKNVTTGKQHAEMAIFRHDVDHFTTSTALMTTYTYINMTICQDENIFSWYKFKQTL